MGCRLGCGGDNTVVRQAEITLCLAAGRAAAASEAAFAAAAILALHGRRCISLMLCPHPSHGRLAAALLLLLRSPLPTCFCSLSLSSNNLLLCLAACGGCLALLACRLLGVDRAACCWVPPSAGLAAAEAHCGAVPLVLSCASMLHSPHLLQQEGQRWRSGSADERQRGAELATVTHLQLQASSAGHTSSCRRQAPSAHQHGTQQQQQQQQQPTGVGHAFCLRLQVPSPTSEQHA